MVWVAQCDGVVGVYLLPRHLPSLAVPSEPCGSNGHTQKEVSNGMDEPLFFNRVMGRAAQSQVRVTALRIALGRGTLPNILHSSTTACSQ